MSAKAPPLDPDVEAALSVVCPRPLCGAAVGEQCTFHRRHSDLPVHLTRVQLGYTVKSRLRKSRQV